MRSIALVMAATMFVACASTPPVSEPAAEEWVRLYRADGTLVGSLVPPREATRVVPASPTVTAWLQGSDVGRTQSGEPVVGVRMTGWKHGDETFVNVSAMVAPIGTTSGTSEIESQLRPMEAGTYTLRQGERVALNRLASYGVTPFSIKRESAPAVTR